MNHFGFLFSLLLVLGTAGGQTTSASEPAAQWQQYVIAGEELSFELPQDPSRFTIYRPQKHPEDPSEIVKKGRMYGAYGNGVVYFILSFENPRGEDDLDAFVREADSYPINGRTRKFERNLSLGGFQGKHFSFSSAVISGLTQFYKSKNHVYLVQATSDDMSRPEIKRFFDSLSFASKKTNYDPDKPPPQSAETFVAAAPSTIGDAKSGAGSGAAVGVTSGVGAGVGPGQGGGTGPAPISPVNPRTGSGIGNGPGSTAGSSPQTTAGNRVFSGRDVTRKALVLAKPAAGYTEEARRNQVTGTVVLKAIFSTSGRVQSITAVKPLPFGLTEKSIVAARNIRFIPALKDGKYVSQYIVLEYTFSLY